MEVLKGIQARIPKELLRSALEEKKLTPNVEMVMNEAVRSESIDPEKRQKIQNMIDTGMFSKSVTQETKNAKKVDEFVLREINKAIKEGKLPPKSKMKYLPSLMKIENEKGKN